MLNFESVRNLYNKTEKYIIDFDNFLFSKTGYRFRDASFDNFVNFLYKPTDPASLGVTRMLFGAMMVLDGPNERGGAEVDLRWGDPRTCHFPLLPWKPPTLPYMTMLYCIMWIGALGISLGYKFKRCAMMFTLSYWYILLLDKSFWNNHSYLFGLVALLLTGSQANNYFSLDSYFDKSRSGRPVPYWNYFILKYQFFILYFVAGLKKSDKEWLSGYAMTNLSSHWVFDPFKYFLSIEQTDYLIVHWFGFIFDLTVCFWMMYEYTRSIAMLFCASFHLMNSRLFSIGMFPWVCLATMPLFYPPDWPKKTIAFVNDLCAKIKPCLNKEEKSMEKSDKTKENDDKKLNTSIDDSVAISKPTEDEAGGEKNNIVSSVSGDVLSLDYRTTEKTSDEGQTIDSNDRDENIHEDSSKKRTSTAFYKLNCEETSTGRKIAKKIVTSLLIVHIILQAFLPYSHFLTKGFNNWTNGLYGYSWDMMVHNWDTILVLVKIVDNESKTEIFLDPEAWTQNDRWTKHGDMLYQYAHCLHRNLVVDLERSAKTETISEKNIDGRKTDILYDKVERFYDDVEDVQEDTKSIVSRDISIYIDVWCSLNGRFQQRMFNPNLDLLKMKWSPLEKVEWLMPLLTEFTGWRETMNDIQEHVYSWNNYSDVLFVADFPGMRLENFMSSDFSNVTLTVLEGQVFYEKKKRNPKHKSRLPEKSNAVHLTKGESVQIKSGIFHTIHTVGSSPACYMYTYMNATRMTIEEDRKSIRDPVDGMKNTAKLPLLTEWMHSLRNIATFLRHVGNALLNIVYGVPMMRRVNIG